MTVKSPKNPNPNPHARTENANSLGQRRKEAEMTAISHFQHLCEYTNTTITNKEITDMNLTRFYVLYLFIYGYPNIHKTPQTAQQILNKLQFPTQNLHEMRTTLVNRIREQRPELANYIMSLNAEADIANTLMKYYQFHVSEFNILISRIPQLFRALWKEPNLPRYNYIHYESNTMIPDNHNTTYLTFLELKIDELKARIHNTHNYLIQLSKIQNPTPQDIEKITKLKISMISNAKSKIYYQVISDE